MRNFLFFRLVEGENDLNEEGAGGVKDHPLEHSPGESYPSGTARCTPRVRHGVPLGYGIVYPSGTDFS